MAASNLLTSGLTIPPAAALNAAASGPRGLAAAGARSLVPLIYGRDRVPALILNVLAKAGDATLVLVQCLWGHALDAVESVTYNDQALPAGASVTHYTGSQTTPDAALVSAFAAQGITYTDTLAGYGYSVFELPAAKFDGQLNFGALVRGRRVYDPRLDSTAGGAGSQRLADPATWAWSITPSLALADWLASPLYGAGLAVDWASVGPAATANDANIGSPSEPRRQLGLTIARDGVTVAALGEALRAYAGCWLVPGAAGMKLLADADATAVASYSHASGQIAQLRDVTLRDLGTSPTAVEIQYTDTTQVPWREASAMASLPGAGTTLPWRLSTVAMPGVQRYSQAYREAVERLNKLTLGDLSLTLELFDEGLRHEQADIVTVTHPVGLTAKPMRVMGVEMSAPGRWVLELTEHDPAAYSTAVQTAPSIPDTTRVPPDGPSQAVTSFAGTVNKGRIVWTWAPCGDIAYGWTELRTSDTNWGAISPAPVFRGAANTWGQVVSAAGAVTLYARHFGVRGNASAASAAATVSVTAGDLVQDGVSGTTLNTDPFCTDLSKWSGSPGAYALATISDGVAGTKTFRNLSGGFPAIVSNSVPVDATKVYRVRAHARKQGAGADGIFYLAAVLYDSAGAEITGDGTFWFYPAAGVGLSADWTEYSGIFGAGQSRTLPSNARFVAVGVFLHYGGTAGWHEVQGVRLEDISEAAAARAAADQANAAITNISSDNVLSKGEKPAVMLQWDTIDGEQPGINARAIAYGISTLRNDYNTAVATLNTYLSGLSPGYRDTSTDTSIVGSTLRSNFQSVYTNKQALLNEIDRLAGTTANWSNIAGQANAPANNATVGATWGSDLAGLPANLAGLTGAEGILNSLLIGSITAAAATALWSNIAGQANAPANNATVGAPNGTFVGPLRAEDVESAAAAQAKANAAQAEATRLAAIDATTKANAAQAEATRLAGIELSGKLNKAAADTLAAPITLATGGAIQVGNTTNGVVMSPSGLAGYKANAVTFSISTTGDVLMRGTIATGTAERSGTTMTGSGAKWAPDGTGVWGTSTTNLTFDGLAMKMNGRWVTDANLDLAPLTATAGSFATVGVTGNGVKTIATVTAAPSGGTGPFTYVWTLTTDADNNPSSYTAYRSSTSASVDQCVVKVNSGGGSTDANTQYVAWTCLVTDSNGRTATAGAARTINWNGGTP